jgi:2-polyprenyl-6-hydroxyphenyl methylase/3-demethylubiquinone-9 3-methyltransferase
MSSHQRKQLDSLNNVDPSEIQKFEKLAARWWDPESEFRPLHQINPLRANWISGKVNLADKKVLDIGCGGGILTEALAQRGATVYGIDMAKASIAVAELHKKESKLEINYECTSAEKLASEKPGEFDIVTCLEVLEHVPDPEAIISACKTLLKPTGDVFLSTINRNPKAYLFAIIGAEYVLNLLPRGTHDYQKSICPSELASWCRANDLSLREQIGLGYNIFTKKYSLQKNIDVNYLAHYAPSL